MNSAMAEMVVPQFTLVDKEDKTGSRENVERPILLRAMSDPEYRKRLIANPKQVLEEEFSVLLGKPVSLPTNFRIKVVEETENTVYLVIPHAAKPGDLPTASSLDPDGGVAYYCTTVGCKPGFSC